MRRATVLIALVATTDASAADRNVPGTYATLAAAYAAAVSGADRIVIGAGTLAPENNVTIAKSLEIVGAGAGSTTLQSMSGQRVFTVSGSAAVTLRDFTIDGRTVGMGLASSATSVTVTNVTITRTNTGGNAPALDVTAGRTDLNNVTFSSNRAQGNAGAAQYGAGTTGVILNCTFTDNDAVSGGQNVGGALNVTNATITIGGTRFTGSDADYGGAIFQDYGSLSISDSWFESGTASRGPAVYNWHTTSFTARRNVFCKNTVPTNYTGAADGDGGLFVRNTANAQITNNVFFGNVANDEGGGLAILDATTAAVTNNTFVENDAVNDGSGLYVGVHSGGANAVTASNNLFLGNLAPNAVELEGAAGTLNLSYSWYYLNGGADTSNVTSNTNATTGVDPQLAGYVTGNCAPANLVPRYNAPVVGTGNPAILDPDGSRSDIGAFGGPNADPALWKDNDTDGVPVMWDCNDTNGAISPLDAEVCDPSDVDEDCDGKADTADSSVTGTSTLYADADGDGHGAAAPIVTCPGAGYVTVGDDCNDADKNTWATTTWYADLDKDTYGDVANSTSACSAPTGYVSNSLDCDDADGAANVNKTWYADVDKDGYGNPAVTATGCRAPAGYVATATDCNDADAKLNPATVWYVDADKDGLGGKSTIVQCTQPAGAVATSTDCNDADVAIGGPTDTWRDADADGWGAGAAVNQCPTAGYVTQSGDCNDNDPAHHPGATFYKDQDGDGQGSVAGAMVSCAPNAGYVTTASDCDDTDKNVKLGGTEVCDAGNRDEDCDKLADDLDPSANVTGTGTDWYVDADNDDHGTKTTASVRACDEPTGRAAASDDCDDAKATVFPGAPEQCNAQDDDCDGSKDEGVVDVPWYQDTDGDGFGDGTATVDCKAPGPDYVLQDGDCDDGNDAAFPDALELCNGDDDDCDGTPDDDPADGTPYFVDADGDGFGDDDAREALCQAQAGYAATGGDCDDADDARHPDATEVCNGADDDCDALVDDGATDPVDWYLDADEDGFGAGTPVNACTGPDGHVVADGDCDDANDAVNPDGTEVCGNEADDDCDVATSDVCDDTGAEGRPPPDTLEDTGVEPVIGDACGCRSDGGAGSGVLAALVLLARRRRRTR